VEASKAAAALEPFERARASVVEQLSALVKATAKVKGIPEGELAALAASVGEIADAAMSYEGDLGVLVKELHAFPKKYEASPPATNNAQHVARQAFDPVAERIKGLTKQIDLLYKLNTRAAQLAAEVAVHPSAAVHLDRRALNKRVKELDDARRSASDQLKGAAYFHRQIAWLQERFPTAEMVPVPGLCRVVTRKDIEKADWSLTPGRYVGVAPPEVDDDFDFDQTIKDIHIELADLNAEAAMLAVTIQKNFEEFGA
jgi:type I restriction enzyme M protein